MFTLSPPLWGGSAADPFDALVTLLMRFNSNVTDEKGHAFTASGGVTYVNPDWLGGQAISINAASNVVTLTTASLDFDFQGDFCIEAGIKVASVSGGTDYGLDIRQTGTAIFAIYFSSDRVGALMRDTVGTNTNITGPLLSFGTPYHFALTRQGSLFTLWVNGASAGTRTFSYVSPSGACNLSIGTNLNGQIAWARITKGNCRYTGSFTAPVEP